MSEQKNFNEALNIEALEQVTGGNDGMSEYFSVYDIIPTNVRVISTYTNCRYAPNGRIAKVYEKGHELTVNGITSDGMWFRLWIYDPEGGECNGYIEKKDTEDIL